MAGLLNTVTRLAGGAARGRGGAGGGMGRRGAGMSAPATRGTAGGGMAGGLLRRFLRGR